MLRSNGLCVLCLGLWISPTGLLAAPATSEAPRDVVDAIYAYEIAEMKKPSPGTAFTSDSLRARYFSKDFRRLITATDARSEKEQEPGPVDFDPVISGQDGDIKKLKVETERAEAANAVVSARFLSFGHPTVVTYEFVKEAAGWKVDDIKGKIDKQAWSVRQILKSAASGR